MKETRHAKRASLTLLRVPYQERRVHRNLVLLLGSSFFVALARSHPGAAVAATFLIRLSCLCIHRRAVGARRERHATRPDRPRRGDLRRLREMLRRVRPARKRLLISISFCLSRASDHECARSKWHRKKGVFSAPRLIQQQFLKIPCGQKPQSFRYVLSRACLDKPSIFSLMF